MITVLRDRYVKGWPRHDGGERAYVLDLGPALTRSYTTDAHFTAYASPNGRRLVKEAIDQLDGIELTSIVFDVDGPDHCATEEWRRELRSKVNMLFEQHPGGYYYETRGGARVVYRQHEPTVLRTQDDANAWSREYAVACAYLWRAFAIEADGACSDWQRLYRLPRATRDGARSPENWPDHGDPYRTQSLVIDATPADRALAEARAARTFREPRARTVSGRTTSGAGVLFYLLSARSDLDGDEAPRGGWIIRCPNRARHTMNTDWTTSTVLYPPDRGDLGAICCLHTHCEQLTAKEWLSFFSESEIDFARQRAGLPPRGKRAA